MGTTVYASVKAICEGTHIYAHSRKDGKDGKAYLIINNSWTDVTTVDIPRTANGKMRSRTILLYGNELVLGENDELHSMCGRTVGPALLRSLPVAVLSSYSDI